MHYSRHHLTASVAYEQPMTNRLGLFVTQCLLQCIMPTPCHFVSSLRTIPGGAKKRPELCVTIMAGILYGDKFTFVHF